MHASAPFGLQYIPTNQTIRIFHEELGSNQRRLRFASPLRCVVHAISKHEHAAISKQEHAAISKHEHAAIRKHEHAAFKKDACDE
jgi:hypothetical protein